MFNAKLTRKAAQWIIRNLQVTSPDQDTVSTYSKGMLDSFRKTLSDKFPRNQIDWRIVVTTEEYKNIKEIYDVYKGAQVHNDDLYKILQEIDFYVTTAETSCGLTEPDTIIEP